uniref:Uncharacterized protein n=1 Tax=Pyramimonas obovata TaxID=1411642 RepID=A0A7S0N1M6_9CHLO|mmetsp:Transcript_18492/g.40458  ORF Transcript_18492/g.40458 Transcript_18492/m.40458 type:complete len:192 (+) Transcript_18492:92-667(+)
MMLSVVTPFHARATNLGARNSSRMRGVQLATPKAPRVQARRTACRTVAVIFPPNLFARFMIPRPGYELGMEDAKDNYFGQIHKEFSAWKQTSESWVEGEFLQRRLKVHSKANGHKLLQAIQQEFYSPNGGGCQIRRETQSTTSLCCQEVRAMFNESRSEVVIDVPFPEDETNFKQAQSIMQKVEDLKNQHW